MNPKQEGVVTITLPVLLPGLNGEAGHLRLHFSKAVALKSALEFCIRRQKPPWLKKPISRCTIEFTRFCHSLMDWDNAASSFKHIGDALVKSGILKDDNPGIVTSFVPIQTKVSMKDKQQTVITITCI